MSQRYSGMPTFAQWPRKHASSRIADLGHSLILQAQRMAGSAELHRGVRGADEWLQWAGRDMLETERES